MAEVLLIDIETAPSLGYYYDPWKEGNIIACVRTWYILSASWKWFGDRSTHVRGLVDYPQFLKDREDDSLLIKDIRDLLENADIIIAHNGDRFDIKKINARILKHGLTPPSPYKTIDTLKVAKKYFGMESNKLDNIGKFLEVGEKIKHQGFELWDGCMKGDEKSWKLMKAYNKQDVVLLEKVYEKLRPWMHTHPNVNILDGDSMSCPKCSGVLTKRGFSATTTGKKQRFQCSDCGGWSISTKTEKIVSIT